MCVKLSVFYSKGLIEIKRTLITPFAVENVREDRMRKIPPFMFWTPSWVYSWPKYSVPKTRPSN